MIPYINFHTHHPAYENELSLGCEEHGMDRRWDSPLPEQEAAFRLQVEESERNAKPLVIHCVRTLEEILRIRKEMRPRQPRVQGQATAVAVAPLRRHIRILRTTL